MLALQLQVWLPQDVKDVEDVCMTHTHTHRTPYKKPGSARNERNEDGVQVLRPHLLLDAGPLPRLPVLHGRVLQDRGHDQGNQLTLVAILDVTPINQSMVSWLTAPNLVKSTMTTMWRSGGAMCSTDVRDVWKNWYTCTAWSGSLLPKNLQNLSMYLSTTTCPVARCDSA